MSSGSSVAIGVRTEGRRVHPVSLGTLGCALGLVGIAWFIGVRPWVHAGPLVDWGARWMS